VRFAQPCFRLLTQVQSDKGLSKNHLATAQHATPSFVCCQTRITNSYESFTVCKPQPGLNVLPNSLQICGNHFKLKFHNFTPSHSKVSVEIICPRLKYFTYGFKCGSVKKIYGASLLQNSTLRWHTLVNICQRVLFKGFRNWALYHTYYVYIYIHQHTYCQIKKR
jgi:hypothetical protein